MKAEARRALFSFLLELLVYSVLVTGYFFLVLHLLGSWLFNLDKEHVRLYAIASVGLIGMGHHFAAPPHSRPF